MFAGTYFAPSYYARSYWPGGVEVVAEPAPAPSAGGVVNAWTPGLVRLAPRPVEPVHHAVEDRMVIDVRYIDRSTYEARLVAVRYEAPVEAVSMAFDWHPCARVAGHAGATVAPLAPVVGPVADPAAVERELRARLAALEDEIILIGLAPVGHTGTRGVVR